MLLGQPENAVYNCYKFSCFAGRNSNVPIAKVNSVILVTAFPNFPCDIPFSVSDMNERNVYHSNTTVFLWDDRDILSI